MNSAGANPKYAICDKGRQFWCGVFKDWCDRQGITPRFGAVGQHGSIALIERFILTLKNEGMRIILVPLRTNAFHHELTGFTYWYNQSHPHSSLRGKTPHETYYDLSPACVGVPATNRALNGRAVRHAHHRTHRSPATVALPFALMCAIIRVANTCRSLS
jgi:hypothetical protein